MVLSGSGSLKMLDIMQRSMNAATMRNDVINNNIANATTPNYKRQDVTFHEELKRALRTEALAPGTPMRTTHEKHIPGHRITDYRSVVAKKTTNYNSYQNNDGNSVDIDREMVEASKNSMYYNSLAQRTAKEFGKLKFLLRS